MFDNMFFSDLLDAPVDTFRIAGLSADVLTFVVGGVNPSDLKHVASSQEGATVVKIAKEGVTLKPRVPRRYEQEIKIDLRTGTAAAMVEECFAELGRVRVSASSLGGRDQDVVHNSLFAGSNESSDQYDEDNL